MKRVLSEWIVFLLASVTVALGTGSVGPMTESVRLTAGAGLLVAAAIIGAGILRWKARDGALIGGFALAVLGLSCPASTWGWAPPLIFCSLSATRPERGPGKRTALALAFQYVVCSFWAYDGFTEAFFLSTAAPVARVVGVFAEPATVLGPSVLGLPGLVGMSLGFVFAARPRRPIGWAYLLLSLLAAPLFAALTIHASISLWPDGGTLRSNPVLLLGLHHVLGATVVFAAFTILGAPATNRRVGWRETVAVLAVVLAMLQALPATVTVTPGKCRKVLFLDNGLVDWELPDFEDLGRYSVGMFGLLAATPPLYGFDAEIVDPEHLLERLDAEPESVLVLINSSIKWNPEQHAAIWSHIEQGGGLLVLGDHTDVGRQRQSLNPLLDRAGISLQFDSAFPLRPGFASCRKIGTSRLFRDISPDRELFIDVGASLAIAAPAVPEVIGSFSFSDRGVMGNLSGAHLGNYYWDRGEPLGDLVLAARSKIGEGRVLVFGDTSGFQNAGIDGNLPRVLPRIFNWLGGGEVRSARNPIAGIALIAGGLLVAVGMLRFRSPLLMLPVLLVGLWASRSPPESTTRMDWPLTPCVGVLDCSASPSAFGFQDEPKGLGSLKILLLRHGYAAYVKRPGGAPTGTPGIIVIVEPAVPYGADDAEWVLRAVRNGATCALFVSATGSANCQEILDAAGVRVRRIALGAVPHRHGMSARRNEPRFVEAYPLKVEANAEHQVLYQYGEYLIALERRYGRGRFVVVGDGAFTQTWNLYRERSGPVLGNLLFLKNILPGSRPRLLEPPRAVSAGAPGSTR
jgi:hypothetical protein